MVAFLGGTISTVFFLQTASGNVGWGSRTGGVIVAGETREICGVQFEGNKLQLGQQVRRGGR